MADNTHIKAAHLIKSTLRQVPPDALCQAFLDGFCRRGHVCDKSHEICCVEDERVQAAQRVLCPPNFLSLAPRFLHPDQSPFDDDGPGWLSSNGPRYDNDHVKIEHIQILPTADEVLSRRLPFMPMKSPYAQHHLPCGQERHIDTQFRQYRHESIEPLVDTCYHAAQQLSSLVLEAADPDYDDRCETPRKTRYSMFRDIAFEELSFLPYRGLAIRISFACPKGLRGDRLNYTNHLEEGMLVALAGLDQTQSLSITFFEVHRRQTTYAMRPQTGNDLRASVILTLADTRDIYAARRMLYNAKDELEEKFVLVEIPKALFAGFNHTLKRLQQQASTCEKIAFLPSIAPDVAGRNPEVSPPNYAAVEGFAFQLDCLRTNGHISSKDPLNLRPNDLESDPAALLHWVDTLCEETTLDRGQARALCENLCRGLAFTQGPPGTGKTFLGISLVRVLLASRRDIRKPILVVCMTNHALDNFLGDLRQIGLSSFVRIGKNSKETWTQEFSMRNVSKRVKKTTLERSNAKTAHIQADALWTEGVSWCESLNCDTLCWPAVRELLEIKYPDILPCFADIAQVDESRLTDVRLARKGGGFAYEYWCDGGDLKDIARLLERFNKLLNKTPFMEENDDNITIDAHQRVVAQISQNASSHLERPSKVDVWSLPMKEREKLLDQWKQEIELRNILDRTAEIHRRYQAVIQRKRNVHYEFDARVCAGLDIVGMTTTACAMHWAILRELGIQTVICEEAGEVMEAQSLCTLLSTVEHSIFIGDPLQLRPQVNEQALSVETLVGAPYRLDESLMERMMLPSEGVAPIASSHLSLQRRMHPDIADLMRATLYWYLEDHESTHHRAPVAGLVDRTFWFDHKVAEDSVASDSTAVSFSNTYEVEMVAGLVEYLVSSNEYDYKDVTVLTPYNGQLAALKARFRDTCSLWLSELDREALLLEGFLDEEEILVREETSIEFGNMLKLATIDNFQGEESKVVILTTVRSNWQASVGFLKSQNRINVACSRARNGFYIVGNASVITSVPMWYKIWVKMSAQKKVGSVFKVCCPRHRSKIHLLHDPQDWYTIPKCQEACGFTLDCGHVCKEICHALIIHERKGCVEPCEKIHETCGHPCDKLCGQPCGDCTYQTSTVTLDCGHGAKLTCLDVANGRTKDEIECTAVVDIATLPCGHQHDVLCSGKESTAFSDCREICLQTLDCGHKCQGVCHYQKADAHQRCQTSCRKELECGHHCASGCHGEAKCPPCQQPCSNSCKHITCSKVCGAPCDPCIKPCNWSCEHQGACSTLCSLPCNRLPCSEPCLRVLACGHRCPSFCGEICPRFCLQCTTGELPEKVMMFLPCQHHFDVQFLDAHFGLGSLYEMDDVGSIIRLRLGVMQRTKTTALRCPICLRVCKGVRRYSLIDQLRTHETNIDQICGKMNSKISKLMKKMRNNETDLLDTFESFCSTLKPGPLAGRFNEQIIENRRNLAAEAESRIIELKENVVKPFENALKDVSAFLHTANDSASFPFRPRLDFMLHGCKVIAMAETVRILIPLRRIAHKSQHTTHLIEGLRNVTIPQAQQLLADLEPRIAEASSRNLKRLEAEILLLRLSTYITLYDLGAQRTFLSAEPDIERIAELSQAFPTSTASLLPLFKTLRRFIAAAKPDIIYTKSTKELWTPWPEYIPGAYTQCRNNHPYSATTWDECPECGVEVPKPDVVDPKTLLRDKEFVLAMRSPRDFDGSSYRAKKQQWVPGSVRDLFQG